MENEQKEQAEEFFLVPLYNAVLVEVEAVDKKLEAAKGTMSAIQAKGLEAAHNTKVMDLFGHSDPKVGAEASHKEWLKVHASLLKVTPDRTVESYLKGIQAELEDTAELVKGLAKEWIAKNTTKDESDALRLQRAELVKKAEAFVTVMRDMSPETVGALKPIPAGPTTPKGGTTQKSKTSRIRFYSTAGEAEGGKRKDYDDSFDLSRVAYYQPFQCASDELKRALKATGWDGSMTTPLPLTKVTTTAKPDKGGNVRTNWIGWDILPDEAKTDEAPEAKPNDEAPKGDESKGDDESN